MALGVDDSMRGKTTTSTLVTYLKFGQDGEMPFSYFCADSPKYTEVKNIGDKKEARYEVQRPEAPIG